ncbi:aldo/keto reductase [Phaeobacter sp. CNT1-3]|nr:aldo/keto reductase [Phaeobacter sp. CNT1-3]
MQKKEMGRTGVMVTDMCLGTMTFGTQTTEAEGHRQIEMALDHGLNFMDTAEMYPVNPVAKETIGRTEEIIGNWIAANPGRRDEFVLATKHSGAGLMAVRDGAPITADSIPSTVEGSLKRLKTDCIDLYQFHWPNRGSYMFRKHWNYDPSSQNRADTVANIEDTLGALQREVEKGNIRYFGLSNESAWGTTQWVNAADRLDLPRVATIQNEYSLLCRMYDTDLAEVSVNEDVGLICYSPLAAGLLTGKYQNGVVPKGSRMDINGDLGARKTDRAFAAVDAYAALAAEHGLNLTNMSLAWARQRPFMCSVIFGATTEAQLQHILDGKDLVLSDEVMAAIDEIHKQHPLPF